MSDVFSPIEYGRIVDGMIVYDDEYELKAAIMISIHIQSHSASIGIENTQIL